MKSLLLIEPDPVLVKIYKDYLEKNGFKIAAAKDAQDAVNKADKKTPDIVVMELQLVGHSGIEFLYEFRSYSEWQKVPVIINSHVPKREFKENWRVLSQELGVIEYLYKPITSLSHLLASIRANTLLVT